MTHQVAVVGGSGYTGAELLRLLVGHPEMDVVAVTADSNAGKAVADVYPSLAPAYGDLQYQAYAAGSLAGVDLVFFALPHGESQRLVPEIAGSVEHVVDLAADFRLPAADYEQWYGHAHGAPEILDGFSYGLPELFRDDVAGHDHVAAPGCYPTTASLALAPLVAAGLVEPTGIIVDAVSGVSGRGRGLTTPSLYSEANESVSAYGLLTHRHTAEMELALSRVSESDVQVLFTPHLAPMTRGILATCYARPATSGLTTAALLERYHAFYGKEPFVTVVDEPPATKSTLGSNSVHVTVRHDHRTGTVLAIAALDNLVKGAAGQAVQGANIVLGLPEDLGLAAVGMVP